MEKQVNLTGDQRLYLQQIFNCLRQNNRWPTFGELDQWFTYYYPDLDIEEIWKSLPQGLTNYMDLNLPENQATLTIPAIYLLENNREALSIFLALLPSSFPPSHHFESVSSKALAFPQSEIRKCPFYFLIPNF